MEFDISDGFDDRSPFEHHLCPAQSRGFAIRLSLPDLACMGWKCAKKQNIPIWNSKTRKNARDFTGYPRYLRDLLWERDLDNAWPICAARMRLGASDHRLALSSRDAGFCAVSGFALEVNECVPGGDVR